MGGARPRKAKLLRPHSTRYVGRSHYGPNGGGEPLGERPLPKWWRHDRTYTKVAGQWKRERGWKNGAWKTRKKAAP